MNEQELDKLAYTGAAAHAGPPLSPLGNAANKGLNFLSSGRTALGIGAGGAALMGIRKLTQNPEPGEGGTLPMGRAVATAAKTGLGYAIPAGILHAIAAGHSGALPQALKILSVPAGIAGGIMANNMKFGTVQELAKLATNVPLLTHDTTPLENRSWNEISPEQQLQRSHSMKSWNRRQDDIQKNLEGVTRRPYFEGGMQDSAKADNAVRQGITGLPSGQAMAVPGKSWDEQLNLKQQPASINQFKRSVNNSTTPSTSPAMKPAPATGSSWPSGSTSEFTGKPIGAGSNGPASGPAPASRPMWGSSSPNAGPTFGEKAMTHLENAAGYKLPGGATVGSMAPGAMMGLNAMRGDANNQQGGLLHGLTTGAGATLAGMAAHKFLGGNPLISGLAQMIGGNIGGKLASVSDLAKIAVGATPSGISQTVTNRPSGLQARIGNPGQATIGTKAEMLRDRLKPQGTLSQALQSKNGSVQELAKRALESMYCKACDKKHEKGMCKKADLKLPPTVTPISAPVKSNSSVFPSSATKANQARDVIADWVMRNASSPVKKANMGDFTQPAMEPMSAESRGDTSSMGGSFGMKPPPFKMPAQATGKPAIAPKKKKKEDESEKKSSMAPIKDSRSEYKKNKMMDEVEDQVFGYGKKLIKKMTGSDKEEKAEKEAALDDMTFTSTFMTRWNKPNTSIGPKLDLYRSAASMLGKTCERSTAE